MRIEGDRDLENWIARYRGKLDLVVLGASAGGVEALTQLFSALPRGFRLPIATVLHLPAIADGVVLDVFQSKTLLEVKEAEDKEPLRPGKIYFAPPNYHLLVDGDLTLSLDADERVNYSRPSIDVLFQSAALSFPRRVAGALLTGSNADGSLGLKQIREAGGLAMVQSPDFAQFPEMPQAAVSLADPEIVLPVERLAQIIAGLA